MKTHNDLDVIWLVEDDDRQAATLEQFLVQQHPRVSKGEVVRIPTESQFLDKLREVFERKAKRPRLVIADVMLPWAFIGMVPEGIEQPPEVSTTHGFRSAGARCWTALRARERTANTKSTPFVFHTVLPKDEFGFNQHSDKSTGYIAKDQPFSRLRKTIEDLTDLDTSWDEANWLESAAEVGAKLLTNPEMKRILFEGLRTPLKDCIPYPA